MTTIRDQVLEFHRVYGVPIGDKPQVPDAERVTLRLRLIAEEFFELLDACRCPVSAQQRADVDACIEWARPASADLPEIADALGDIAYVTEACNLEFGIDSGPVLAEIQRSNLSKLGADGKPILREDGKVQKGPNFTLPDIEGVLRAQGWTK